MTTLGFWEIVSTLVDLGEPWAWTLLVAALIAVVVSMDHTQDHAARLAPPADTDAAEGGARG